MFTPALSNTAVISHTKLVHTENYTPNFRFSKKKIKHNLAFNIALCIVCHFVAYFSLDSAER